MLAPDATGVPDWIQATGVLVALVFTGYQLRQQAKDARESAGRHEKAERDASERHNREMVDRRRERLLTHYPIWSQSAEDYLMNMAIAAELRTHSQGLAQIATEERNAQAKANALTMQNGAMQHHTIAQAAMTRAVTAHLAIRFDDSPKWVERIDDHMAKVQGWREGPTEGLVVEAHKLVHDRSNALRPQA